MTAAGALAFAYAAPAAGNEAVLAGAIRACAEAVATGTPLPPRDVATLNSFAGDDPPVPVLLADGTRRWASTDPARSALAALAREAIETIAGQAGALRRCEAPECGAVFADRSRGRGRRWCAMARCGNRAKVAAYRRRQR